MKGNKFIILTTMISILYLSVLQIILFIFLQKRKKFYIQFSLSILLLLCYFWLLPPFFIPKEKPNAVNCGNVVIGVYFSFWIFGFIANLIVTSIFLLIYFKKSK